MSAAENLEKLIELESNLKSQYQAKLDAKDAELEAAIKKQEEQQAVISKQLEQIKELSTSATGTKHLEQQNREISNRANKLQEEVDTQKKRIKTLQKDLAAERDELKSLKQFDPEKMKKNLDASKKKLAEKTSANELLQKNANKAKAENLELTRKVEELEKKVEELEAQLNEEETSEEAEVA